MQKMEAITIIMPVAMVDRLQELAIKAERARDLMIQRALTAYFKQEGEGET